MTRIQDDLFATVNAEWLKMQKFLQTNQEF